MIGRRFLPALMIALALPGQAQSDSLIQPGAQVSSSVGGCTLNFVFTDGTERYIGTAAHCTSGVGERMRVGGTPFGTVVFAEFNTIDDFALIRVDPGRRASVDPSVRTWGGPTGSTVSTETARGDALLLSGYGLAFSTTSQTRARAGVLVSDSADTYSADTLAVWGDSGGPIVHQRTGKALGIISSFGTTTTDVGPTMERIRSRLAGAGFSLTLETAPYQGL